MTPPLVFIVEDEPKLARVLEEYLQRDGFRTHQIERGDQVMAQAKELGPDLILLDLMLPGLDGMEVCRELRRFLRSPSS